MWRALVLWLLCAGPAVAEAPAAQKQLIGAVETFEVVEAGISYRARIDTGAASCSLHAEDVRPLSGGTHVSFILRDEKGRVHPMTLPLEATTNVKTSEGSERRYKVLLTLKWRDHAKPVAVTLNDRSALTYPLLLGRNWLRGDFVVDVEMNSDD